MKHILFSALMVLAPVASYAQIPIGSDNASNYGGTWSGNQGSGFGAWNLVTQFEVGDGIGHFITNPGDGIMGSSWRMSANRHQNNSGTPIAVAFRELDSPLDVGQTLSIRMKHGPIAVGGKVGLFIRSGNETTIINRSAGTRLELSFSGGASNTIVNDEGTDVSIGFNTNTSGPAVQIDFTLTSINTYDLKVTDLTLSQEYTLTGRTLAGVTGNPINSIALFIEQAQTGDVYFNNLSVSSLGTVQISNTAGWRMMSSPVSTSLSDILQEGWTQGATSGADVTNGSSNVYGHTGSAWQAVTNLTTTNATAATGFIYYHYNDDDNNGVNNATVTTFTVSGTEFAAPGTLAFSNGGAGAADGWNLLGNPFASTIDWDLISPSLSNVDGTVYVYTNVSPDVAALGEGFNSYIAWNGTTGSLANGLIAPFQGFFVKANTISASVDITASSKSGGGTFRNKDAGSAPTFSLRLSDGSRHNDAWFAFTQTGDIARDAYDAYKLDPLDGSFISVFSTMDGVPMDIQNLPSSFENRLEIQISLKSMLDYSAADGDFTLGLANLDGIDDAWSITLIDHETNTEVDLRSDSHSFRWTAPREKMRPTAERVGDPIMQTAAASEPRFTLIIDPLNTTDVDRGPETVGRMELEQNYPNPFNPSTVVGFNVGTQDHASLPVRLTVYDMLGREIMVLVDGVMPAGSHTVTFDASTLTSGVYLYKLEAGGQVMTRRMTLVK